MRRHDETGDPGRPRLRPAARRSASRSPIAGAIRPRLILGTVAVVVALVLAGGSLAAYAKYRSVWDGINRVDVQGDLGPKRPPVDPKAQNILVIGSDTRSGVNGHIGGRNDIGGARSDTIMLLHVAPGAHQIAVLSIPRDSVVPILSCTAEDGTTGQTAQPSQRDRADQRHVRLRRAGLPVEDHRADHRHPHQRLRRAHVHRLREGHRRPARRDRMPAAGG